MAAWPLLRSRTGLTRMLKRRIVQLKARYAPDPWSTGERRQVMSRLRGSSAPMKADLDGDSRTLLIAFGGMVGGFGIPFFEFSTLTGAFPVKRLFVRDLRQAWYHLGMPGRGELADGRGRHARASWSTPRRSSGWS